MSKSTFTLTFAIELLSIDEWEDCKEGYWIDVGSQPVQGMKLHYEIYPGNKSDIDIAIWPHVAKVSQGNSYVWVRTWLYLERRWFSFSIRHALPVKIMDLQEYVVSIIPTMGSSPKFDKNLELYIAPLKFCEKRYFGPVLEAYMTDKQYMKELIWNCVVNLIPASFLDGKFEVPCLASDIRHSNLLIERVKDLTIARSERIIFESTQASTQNAMAVAAISTTKKSNTKDKNDTKFELRLTGDCILAGAGRVISFSEFGKRPTDMGEMVVLLSSANLPASDDYPMLFVNIETLYDVPCEIFSEFGVTELYTRWKLADEVHFSEPQLIRSSKDICMNDHHALPLHYKNRTQVMSTLLHGPFQIELRGTVICPSPNRKDVLFGKLYEDNDFDKFIDRRVIESDTDVLIAICKINVDDIVKGKSVLIRGDYPVLPLKCELAESIRQSCTNDTNAIRLPHKLNPKIPASVILEAQMTLEISIGYVGCTMKKTPTVMVLYSGTEICFLSKCIELINCTNSPCDSDDDVDNDEENDDDTKETDCKKEVLSGFAIDLGDKAFIYLEGSRNEETKVVFESIQEQSNLFCVINDHHDKVYPELEEDENPFLTLKMYVPLCSLLACPPVYARPAVPLPAKAVVMKLDRIFSGEISRDVLPTMNELRSFILELCAPPKPSGSTCLCKSPNYMEHTKFFSP